MLLSGQDWLCEQPFFLDGKSTPDKNLKSHNFSCSYLMQSQVVNHICSKQDSISSKIKVCCEKKTLEREACIINANKDDRPEGLSLREAKFTESENVCQERDSDPDKFFAEYYNSLLKV